MSVLEIHYRLNISFAIYSVFYLFYYILPMEHTHQKKHFSEEETLEKVEQKIDEKMEKIMKQSFIHTFLNLKIVKDVLASHVVNYANHKIHQSLKMIFSIVGRISLIA